ncbi:MAG: SAVED domain-containing protein [Dehalococcoidia bacterium]|nr:SAVED domain-containing protein [Dehalococcoidia bacterium]
MNCIEALVSYQWGDSADAERLHEELALRGFVVHHDRCSFETGGRLPAQMEVAVQRSDLVVALLTKHSLYLEAPAGTPRPALDGEFIPSMQRRRTHLAELGVDPLNAVKARPVVIPVLRGLGDPHGEGSELVRIHTGENIGSLWMPSVTQDGDLPLADAQSIARGALRAVIASALGEPVALQIVTRGSGEAPIAGLNVDATSLLGGRDRRVGASLDWDRFVGALRDVRDALGHGTRCRSIELFPKCHLAAAVALGRVFSQSTGWKVSIPSRNGLVETVSEPEGAELAISWDAEAPNGDIAVQIDLLGHPVFDMARRATIDWPQPPLGQLQVSRQDSRREMTPEDVMFFARRVADEIRRIASRYAPQTVHLFCAAPVEFGVLLAYRLTALNADLVVHEPDGERYHPAVRIPRQV